MSSKNKAGRYYTRNKAGGYYTRNVGQIEASVKGTHVPDRLKDFMDSIQEDNEDLCEHNNQINANCSDCDDIQEEEAVKSVKGNLHVISSIIERQAANKKALAIWRKETTPNK